MSISFFCSRLSMAAAKSLSWAVTRCLALSALASACAMSLPLSGCRCMTSVSLCCFCFSLSRVEMVDLMLCFVSFKYC